MNSVLSEQQYLASIYIFMYRLDYNLHKLEYIKDILPQKEKFKSVFCNVHKLTYQNITFTRYFED